MRFTMPAMYEFLYTPNKKDGITAELNQPFINYLKDVLKQDRFLQAQLANPTFMPIRISFSQVIHTGVSGTLDRILGHHNAQYKILFNTKGEEGAVQRDLIKERVMESIKTTLENKQAWPSVGQSRVAFG